MANALQVSSFEQRIKTLSFQNERLKTQREADKQAIEGLEARLTSQEAAACAYGQTLLAVNR